MAAAALQEKLAKALEVQAARPQEAIAVLRDVVLADSPNDAESIKVVCNWNCRRACKHGAIQLRVG